jgi:hypothetical protein
MTPPLRQHSSLHEPLRWRLWVWLPLLAGEGCLLTHIVGGGADMTTTDSVPAADSSGTASAASDATGGAKPPARSYWCSARETDAVVSKMDDSANIRSVATSSISARSRS